MRRHGPLIRATLARALGPVARATRRWAASRYLLLSVLPILLAACAAPAPHPGALGQQTVMVRPAAPPAAVPALPPVFLLHQTSEAHNRIGQVRAEGKRDSERIRIDVDRPVVYTATQQFTTERGTYSNLIHRVHFPELPYSLIPFHFGAGRHVGLLVLLTLDAQGQVLLVTTANTCGCYAITIPTVSLAKELYPEDWPEGSVSVFGEQLPARLPAIGPDDRLVVRVRPDLQRIMALEVEPVTAALPEPVVMAEPLPLASLRALELPDGSLTSFYHDRWPLRGHVKGAIKPWETLLLSLVSLDLFVGMDKEYGDDTVSGNPFYTSLKPWNRTTSDMNDFAAYLRFNGWKL